jgi:hypothetical protein
MSLMSYSKGVVHCFLKDYNVPLPWQDGTPAMESSLFALVSSRMGCYHIASSPSA